jgi:hypothetical protein
MSIDTETIMGAPLASAIIVAVAVAILFGISFAFQGSVQF